MCVCISITIQQLEITPLTSSDTFSRELCVCVCVPYVFPSKKLIPKKRVIRDVCIFRGNECYLVIGKSV